MKLTKQEFFEDVEEKLNNNSDNLCVDCKVCPFYNGKITCHFSKGFPVDFNHGTNVNYTNFKIFRYNNIIKAYKQYKAKLLSNI